MVNEDDEEFEEFDETNEVEPEERTAPEPELPEPIDIEDTPRKKGRPAKVKEVKAVPVQAPAQTQPQYVGVPRAVPIETMINEIYDSQQEIKQVLMVIMEKLNIK